MKASTPWLAVLRRRCLPRGEDPSLSRADNEALERFRSLGSHSLRPLTWDQAEARTASARILLVGSWHPLGLQAEAAGILARRLARRDGGLVLALGMVRESTIRRRNRPRGLPADLLPSLLKGLGRAEDKVEVRGLGGLDQGLGNYQALAAGLAKFITRGKRILFYHGELHLLPHLLPRALKALLPREEVQVVWPGAPAPFLRLARRGRAAEPALLEGGDLYLPLCHPLHRPASLQAWKERAPILPPTRLLPWLGRGPGMEEAFTSLLRRTARVLGFQAPSRVPLLSFEEEAPLARIKEEFPPGPAMDLARRALEEGEGLALPQIPLLVLGSPGAVEAAEEAAHLLHLTHTGLHRTPLATPLHGLLVAALAEAVARGAARLALPGSPPWRPVLDLVPPSALSWKRRAWTRLISGGSDLPPAEGLSPREAGAAAHLLGYATAERILTFPDGRKRLSLLARRKPPLSAEECARLLREALR